jgi:hypothetical protein
MKSLETQLVEKEAELVRLREVVKGLEGTRSRKGTPNTVDLVESYKDLGLSHQEAVSAAGVESAVINLTNAQRQLIESAQRAGLSDAEATLFALGRRR